MQSCLETGAPPATFVFERMLESCIFFTRDETNTAALSAELRACRREREPDAQAIFGQLLQGAERIGPSSALAVCLEGALTCEESRCDASRTAERRPPDSESPRRDRTPNPLSIPAACRFSSE
jgi:hypothetical protein